MAAASAAHALWRKLGTRAFGPGEGATFASQHQDFGFDVRALALTA
jgi:hypothetical protein